MSHAPATCEEHLFSAWTTDPVVPDGVTVQRLKRTCYVCGLVECEDDAPDEAA